MLDTPSHFNTTTKILQLMYVRSQNSYHTELEESLWSTKSLSELASELRSRFILECMLSSPSRRFLFLSQIIYIQCHRNWSASLQQLKGVFGFNHSLLHCSAKQRWPELRGSTCMACVWSRGVTPRFLGSVASATGLRYRDTKGWAQMFQSIHLLQLPTNEGEQHVLIV